MADVAWFDQLSLDPAIHPVGMGTRSLGPRPWLVPDEDAERDLHVKADLLRHRRDKVLFLTQRSLPAAERLLELVNPGVEPDDAMHPLEQAARAVQEDLLLLERRSDGWHLDASCLCFPTRWRLLEKVDQHIADVHGPVRGYDPLITKRVDQLFDRLTDRPVWRRNWFLMTDPTLFQPNRPEHETVIPADRILDDLYIRSERQTLRLLIEGWCVFTIRIQQRTLGELLTTDQRRSQFRDWVEHVSDDFGQRRHLTEPQRTELLAALP